MTSTEKYGITKFDEQNYTQIVVDFILDNPGRTGAYLLSKEKRIGRKRFYETILPTLRRKKVIIEKKKHKKARDIMLFIREDNPLYIVSKEVSEFEDLYPRLLTKVKEEVEGWRSEGVRDPVTVNQDELFLDSTLFLFETLRVYMLRSVMVWSRTTQDKYTREILSFTIFSKLYQMQVKMSETFGDMMLERAWRPKNAFITSVATELSEIKERIEIISARLNRYKIKKEVEPVSNFIMKILITELARQRIYSKSSTYKWKIDANDVEELAKSMEKENPTRHQVETMLEEIASIEFDQWRGK